MLEIRWIEKGEIQIILPLLETINEGTDRMILERRLEEMMAAHYHCAGVFVGGQLAGICGAWVLHKHYIGKHIELDNVVILPEYRNDGMGAQLIAWLEAWANSENCNGSELNCYVHNSPGIKFWLNQGYKLLGFHFQKRW